MKLFLSYFLTINFLLTVFLIGCQHPVPKNEAVYTTIKGKIYVVGNEPFTELAIQTENEKTYTLRGDLVLELKSMQGQWVKLKGEIIRDRRFLYSSEGFLVEQYEPETIKGGIDE